MKTAYVVSTQFTDAARWDGVLHKDTALDGHYFFAVITTGIYCRPSCPSRTPKCINVRFYDSTAAARADGFRACLRCAPDGLSKREQQTQAVLHACRLIEASDARVSLPTLAEKVGLSPHHFHRIFKDISGVTPHDYYKARQIAQIGPSIINTDSVTDAIYAAGFSSSGRFYENTAAMLGMTPTAFKTGGAGETIRVAVRASALGLVLVAATARGICTIEFGEDESELMQRLTARFPHAQLYKEDAQFAAWLTTLLAHFRQPKLALDLPLDIRGTAFQQQVWNALQKIPLGHTQSYSEVAQRIGKPKAARAVATACASNVLAVAIPCHRVVRGTGELSGYRWGVERKRSLLEAEAKVKK